MFPTDINSQDIKRWDIKIVCFDVSFLVRNYLLLSGSCTSHEISIQMQKETVLHRFDSVPQKQGNRPIERFLSNAQLIVLFDDAVYFLWLLLV